MAADPFVVAVQRVGTDAVLAPQERALVFDRGHFTVADAPSTVVSGADGASVEGVTKTAIRTDVFATKEWATSQFGGGAHITGTATTGAGVAVAVVTDSGGAVQLEWIGHGLTTGDCVLVHGVDGVDGANGFYSVSVTDADNFLLVNSSFSGAYVSGGTILRCKPILAIPAADGAVTRCTAALQAVKNGVGYATATLDITAVINGSAIVDGDTNFVGTPVDDTLGVFAYLVSGGAEDAGKVELTTTIDHDVWTDDAVEVFTTTAPNIAGQWRATKKDAMHFTLQSSAWDAGYRYAPTSPSTIPVVTATLTARNKSIQAAWDAGTLTLYVVGHPTEEDLNWSAEAYAVMTTA